MGKSDGMRQLVEGLGLFSLGLGTAQLLAPGAMNRLIGVDDDAKSRAVMRWLGGAREVAAGVGIESRYRPDLWLWARVAGDMLDLSMLGAVLASPRRDLAGRSRAAVATAAVVGVTVADVVAAVRVRRNGAQNGEQGKTMSDVEAKASITVNRPVEEVFVYWQNFENLPQFMAHLESVESLGEGRSRWRASGLAGVEVEWEAEVTDERINEFIAWRSVGGSTVENSGRVEFRPAPGARGTEVRVCLTYRPPAGKLGHIVAKLFGEAPDQQIRDDLRRFKQVVETGEVVRSEGTPDGPKARRQVFQRPAQPVAS